MSSIRGFLVTLLLASIVLTIFLSVLQGYRAGSSEIHSQNNDRLVDIATLLSNQHFNADTSSYSIATGNNFAFQVFDSKKALLHQSNTAIKQPIAPLKQGFDEANFNGYRWYTYTLFNQQSHIWIIVAERLDIRFNLSEKIVLKSLMPIVFEIPLAALLIWLLVGHGLKPLYTLSTVLKNKQENDLTPLDIKQPYKEVDDVIQSSNSLLKRLRQSFEREKNFASDVAHELRTPLSVLKIDLFNLSQNLGKDNQDVQALNHGVNRMERLVQQILTLYRTTPDQFMASYAWVDLYVLAQTVLAERFAVFENKLQTVELLGEPVVLRGDKSALKILLVNLVENANKYTPKNGNIRVSVFERHGYIELQVEDSGSGIPESQYTRVFERFYRIGGDCHPSNEVGCGIGLSIVKHIVDLHKAEINFQHSGFNSGLLVQVLFPKNIEDGNNV